MLGRAWGNISVALSRSPGLTASLIILTAFASLLFGAVLTPTENVSAVPFVFPTLVALFQGVRWVQVTAVSMIGLYLPVAFGIESVALSAGLINVSGLVLFGIVFSRVADQRQRLRQHAASLERMEENLKFAMSNSNVRLFSHDQDLRYTWVPNPLPSFPREQMLGRTDLDLFPPNEARALMAVKHQSLNEEREIQQELTLTRDGEPRTIRLSVVPTYMRVGDERRKTGITCVSVDLTDLYNAIRERDELVARQEQALEEAAIARANLESFTSLIAHDLLQPLTVLQGYIDVLRRRLGPDAPPEQMRALDGLGRSVLQINRLVDDLRDVAAMQQGRFSINTELVNLVDVVSQVVSDYESMTDAHNIVYRSPEYLLGHVDPARLSQLISNLLSNAVKYSHNGGEIVVELTTQGNTCRIEVTDQGQGMYPEDHERLFEMFSRLENAHAVQGLGLGLYISKAIAEAHSGTITVDSEPGKGSTFAVTFPLSPRLDFQVSARTLPGTGPQVND